MATEWVTNCFGQAVGLTTYWNFIQTQKHPSCELIRDVNSVAFYKTLSGRGMPDVKGIVHTKMKIYSPSNHPRVYFFIRTYLETIVCKKQIHHKGVLTLNCRFWPKYKSIIHNNAYSSEKVQPLLSLTKPPTYLFLDCYNLYLLLDLCIFLSWFRQDDFFTAESNIVDIEEVMVWS